jgi:hypothetical protein
MRHSNTVNAALDINCVGFNVSRSRQGRTSSISVEHFGTCTVRRPVDTLSSAENASAENISGGRGPKPRRVFAEYCRASASASAATPLSLKDLDAVRVRGQARPSARQHCYGWLRLTVVTEANAYSGL